MGKSKSPAPTPAPQPTFTAVAPSPREPIERPATNPNARDRAAGNASPDLLAEDPAKKTTGSSMMG